MASRNSANGVRVNILPHATNLRGVMLWYFLRAKLYSALPWKKTAWTCAAFPVEFLWAFDIFPLHPENMATVAAARRQSKRLIEHAESMGYSRDLCSYFKTNVGAVDTGITMTQGGIDKPDIITCTNAICDTHWKWFQIQAQKLKVPFFMIDVPKQVSGTDEKTIEGYIDYLVEQFLAFAEFVRKYTGKKIDEKRFRKVQELSDRLCALWQEIFKLRMATPSPYSSAETSAAFFPLVVMPGVKKGISFFESILGDIQARVARGEGTLPPGAERYRILFEGIPFWYRMRFMFDLARQGAVVTYEPYTFSFGPRKTLGLSFDKSLREVARLIMETPYSYNLEKRIAYFKTTIKEYKIDGVILHENLSCRPSSTGMVDLKNAIQRDCDIPVLILQCDMNDPRAFSEAQVQGRIDSFIELMEAKRK
jgi:benzoyl-CoA reductase/2-hydroxyglutaryl-CoA dehydratase subunit BcrC/BadD/HgdB